MGKKICEYFHKYPMMSFSLFKYIHRSKNNQDLVFPQDSIENKVLAVIYSVVKTFNCKL